MASPLGRFHDSKHLACTQTRNSQSEDSCVASSYMSLLYKRSAHSSLHPAPWVVACCSVHCASLMADTIPRTMPLSCLLLRPCWIEPVPGQNPFIFTSALASDTGSRSPPRGFLSNRQACELYTSDLVYGLGESSAIQLGKRMGVWECLSMWADMNTSSLGSCQPPWTRAERKVSPTAAGIQGEGCGHHGSWGPKQRVRLEIFTQWFKLCGR